MGLTSDQIIALAPDSASAVAGRGLANAAKWQNLGASGRALWGECKGSGAKPYQAQVDVSGPAFKCSCPSRKFPCKHGLGISLLFAAKPELFATGEAPAWVTEWLAMRDGREAKRAEPAEVDTGLGGFPSGEAVADPAGKSPADAQAQAKRQGERERKVDAGIAELEMWLQDVVRGGLVQARGQGYRYFDAMAARLVDAQAPGLARLVRQLGSEAAKPHWQDALLGGLGRLQLLCDAYRRRASLPPDVAEDVRTVIGWTQREEALRETPGVRDQWFVAGTKVTEEENLRVGRTWLFGAQSGRRALLLQFSHGTQALALPFASGQWLDAELAFYPGNLPLRALVLQSQPSVAASVAVSTIREARSEYAQSLARMPWSSSWPVAIGPVRLLPPVAGTEWRLRDESGDELSVACSGGGLWPLLALTAGSPVTLFGAMDGEAVTPCGARLASASNSPAPGGFVPL